MYYVALRMLMGDTARYLALVVGLAFSATLVIQQGSIFTGLMRRAASNVEKVPQADIWVMHPATQYFEERKAIPDTALQRVRGVEGVDWAEPLLIGGGSAILPGGKFVSIQVVGFDRVSKIGLPMQFESGAPELIEQPDAIFWDNVGVDLYKSIQAGDVLEINDRRARVAGLVAAPRSFSGGAVVYTTFERAKEFVPGERNRMSFVLAGVKDGYGHAAVATRIRERTALGVKTTDEFFWATIAFFMRNTGVPVNFGITIILGLIIGAAVAGQTFYSFTLDNIRHFGTLKAMGVSNFTLVKMVLLQAALVGLTGWGLGAGLAAFFGKGFTSRSTVAFLMTPHLLALSFAAMLLTMLLAAYVSVRRVLKVEPAIVFK